MGLASSRVLRGKVSSSAELPPEVLSNFGRLKIEERTTGFKMLDKNLSDGICRSPSEHRHRQPTDNFDPATCCQEYHTKLPVANRFGTGRCHVIVVESDPTRYTCQ